MKAKFEKTLEKQKKSLRRFYYATAIVLTTALLAAEYFLSNRGMV